MHPRPDPALQERSSRRPRCRCFPTSWPLPLIPAVKPLYIQLSVYRVNARVGSQVAVMASGVRGEVALKRTATVFAVLALMVCAACGSQLNRSQKLAVENGLTTRVIGGASSATAQPSSGPVGSGSSSQVGA